MTNITDLNSTVGQQVQDKIQGVTLRSILDGALNFLFWITDRWYRPVILLLALALFFTLMSVGLDRMQGKASDNIAKVGIFVGIVVIVLIGVAWLYKQCTDGCSISTLMSLE